MLKHEKISSKAEETLFRTIFEKIEVHQLSSSAPFGKVINHESVLENIFGNGYRNFQNLEQDTINLVKNSNSGAIFSFSVFQNKFIFFKMSEKLLNTEIKPFVPFKDVRIPDLGKQYG